MNKEWLEDYESREIEESDKFIKQVIAGNLPSDYRYPAVSRFSKLQDPVSQLYYNHIWAQIPLYGSSILTLAPFPKERFLEWHGLRDLREFEQAG